MIAFAEFRSKSPASTVRRAVLVIAVAFGIFATCGWTAVASLQAPTGPQAAELAAWGHGEVDGRPLPPPGTQAATVSGFFHSLTPAERDRLAARFPYVVGNLEGAPVTLRYRANHTALAKARAKEAERMRDPRLSPVGRQDAQDRLDRLDDLLAPGRQVLAFDPTGRGRVAEVLGDLDRAARVSVVVPGVDTDLSSYEKPEEPYTAPGGMARELYAAEEARAPGRRIAVIAWADYTTPEGLGMDAATDELASAGASRLLRTVEALPGDPSTALFCHSYGSVVCGLAASRLPDQVTDIAVAGSPGMRTSTVAGLHTKARVWATRSGSDWIQDVPHLELAGLGHGDDPVGRSFGSRVLSAAGAHGHTEYFRRGTASLANFAALGTAEYAAVTCAAADPDCSAPHDHAD